MKAIALLLLATACGGSTPEAAAPYRHSQLAYGDPTLCVECVFTDSCGFGERVAFEVRRDDVTMSVESECPSGEWTFRVVGCPTGEVGYRSQVPAPDATTPSEDEVSR